MNQDQEDFLARVRRTEENQDEKTVQHGKIMLKVTHKLGVLDEAFIDQLFHDLPKRSEIIGVNFGGATFSKKAASKLAEKLGENTVKLKCISFNTTVFKGNNFKEVIDSLKSNTTLKLLRVDGAKVRKKENHYALIEILKNEQNTTLSSIRITGGDITLLERIEKLIYLNKILKWIKSYKTHPTASLESAQTKKKTLELFCFDFKYEDIRRFAEKLPKNNIPIKIVFYLNSLEKEQKDEITKILQEKEIVISEKKKPAQKRRSIRR